jgi:predicted transglutaminase-like cysteine proteinase
MMSLWMLYRVGRNRPFKKLLLSLVIAGAIVCSLGLWQARALRSPNFSPSQKIALRFLDLSAADTVALRFPESTPSFYYPSTSQIAAAQYFLDPTASVPKKTFPVRPLDHLIDFRVTAALPPIGHSRFCLRYPDDCKVREGDLSRQTIVMDAERWSELNRVNQGVNRGILAEVTPGNGTTEEWTISPRAGDCKNYAITKRHELLARGWPSRSLLLSEVVLSSGEHHLILVVRFRDADFVLDNLKDDVRLVAATYAQYTWARIQSPQNPQFWLRVRQQDAQNAVALADK